MTFTLARVDLSCTGSTFRVQKFWKWRHSESWKNHDFCDFAHHLTRSLLVKIASGANANTLCLVDIYWTCSNGSYWRPMGTCRLSRSSRYPRGKEYLRSPRRQFSLTNYAWGDEQSRKNRYIFRVIGIFTYKTSELERYVWPPLSASAHACSGFLYMLLASYCRLGSFMQWKNAEFLVERVFGAQKLKFWINIARDLFCVNSEFSLPVPFGSRE